MRGAAELDLMTRIRRLETAWNQRRLVCGTPDAVRRDAVPGQRRFLLEAVYGKPHMQPVLWRRWIMLRRNAVVFLLKGLRFKFGKEFCMLQSMVV
ncbi:MAG: hypothetical protein ACLR9I_03130 [Eisenbergiella sp.]